MGRRRFGPAIGALSLAAVLAAACATSGGGLTPDEVIDSGTRDVGASDGTSADATRRDAMPSQDSSVADTAADTSSGDDAGVDATGIDATTPDASADSAADASVDSAADTGTGPCSQTCTTGCCDTQGVCHTTFSDQYCPTTNMGGGACEDCTTQSGACILFVNVYICF